MSTIRVQSPSLQVPSRQALTAFISYNDDRQIINEYKMTQRCITLLGNQPRQFRTFTSFFALFRFLHCRDLKLRSESSDEGTSLITFRKNELKLNEISQNLLRARPYLDRVIECFYDRLFLSLYNVSISSKKKEVRSLLFKIQLRKQNLRNRNIHGRHGGSEPMQ